jgi:hypothetical protein
MSQHVERNALRGLFHPDAIVPLNAIGRQASSAPYRISAMSIDHPSAGPVLKSIRIRLGAEAGRQTADERQESVLSALAAALIAVNHSVSPAWTVQAAPGANPLLYDLTPLPEHPVSVEEARAMSYALRGQPQIAEAEPTFAVSNGRSSDPAQA